jgi:peptide/nickel transport system ATP-binding protein/oligopeptide transport system ATP-binding protein
MSLSPILDIQDLHTSFFTNQGEVKAVDGLSLSIHPGETLGLVGESGCGKSVTALSIMRLVPSPPGKITSGKIIFDGTDLTSLSETELCQLRGNDISMIFQEPMTCLNPVFTIGNQIAESMRLHLGLNKQAARKRSVELLDMVGIPSPEQRLKEYPHQLSGGMRQRVMIAMALSCHPKLLIADEPTTALDVTIQAQILELIKQLKARLGMVVLLITHDLGIVADTANRVAIMYAGKLAELAPTRDIFYQPKHPYTIGLLNSLPRLEKSDKPRQRLGAIPGSVPNLLHPPAGCRFNPRCPKTMSICRQQNPRLVEVSKGHWVGCWLYK